MSLRNTTIVLGEAICRGPWVSLHVLTKYAKNAKPRLLYLGHFSELGLYQAALRDINVSQDIR